MRPCILLTITLFAAALASAQEAPKPLSPEEALKKVDQEVTVRMEIKSTGGNTARFLNSETDFRSEKNFAVFIPHLSLASFQKAGIADPGQHYKGKTILVTGQVVMSQGRPVLRVEESSQIKLQGSAAPQPILPKRPKQK
jgi:hypothetical protein